MAKARLPNGRMGAGRRNCPSLMEGDAGLYARTRQEALGKLRVVQRALQEGLPVAPERLTVEAVFSRWIESLRPRVRHKTLASYQHQAHKHILPELGHVNAAQVSADQIERLLTTKGESGLSPRTVQYLHAIMRQACGWAERRSLVVRNVVKLVEPPRAPRYEVQPLDVEEAQAFLHAVQGDRLEALFSTLLSCGRGRRWPSTGKTWTWTTASSLCATPCSGSTGTGSSSRRRASAAGAGFLCLTLPLLP